MAKWQNDLMLDAAFDWIRARITGMSVCSTMPTTASQAYATYKLADIAMTSTDLVISNGDTSGRKVRMGAKSGVTIDTTGTARQVALYGTTGTPVLLLVTTCTTQALTTGNTVNFPVWDDEILDVA